MRTFSGVADLSSAVGSHLGYSAWHTITQERIDMFAAATGDHQWIHVDRDRAAAGPFGATIAHGYLTLSLASMLMWEVYEVEGLTMGVNYGADKVRFLAPVLVDSRVRGEVELLSVDQTKGGHRVASRLTIEIENGDKPACVVDTLALLA